MNICKLYTVYLIILHDWMRQCHILYLYTIPVKLPWIFPGAPLKVNGVPGNIQGNVTGMQCVWLFGCFISIRTHYSEVSWASRRLKSPETRLLIQQHIEANNNKKSKLHIRGSWYKNPSMSDGFPLQRARYVRSVSMAWCLHQAKTCDNGEKWLR